MTKKKCEVSEDLLKALYMLAEELEDTAAGLKETGENFELIARDLVKYLDAIRKEEEI